MLAWVRRLIVSAGIGSVSYALMLGIMVLSVVYDQELEPVITFAFDSGRSITNWLDSLVSGTYWGQIAVNSVPVCCAARDCWRILNLFHKSFHTDDLLA